MFWKSVTHNGYLKYKLPRKWAAEEEDDELLIYNPDGNGAIVLSFFNSMYPK